MLDEYEGLEDDDEFEDENFDQEYHNDIVSILNDEKLIPHADTMDSESVRLLTSVGEDFTTQIFESYPELIDGFEVIQPGFPAKIAIFPSDLDHYSGGYIVVFGENDGRWQWSTQYVTPEQLSHHLFEPDIPGINRIADEMEENA